MSATRADFQHIADALREARCTPDAIAAVARHLKNAYPKFDVDRFTRAALPPDTLPTHEHTWEADTFTVDIDTYHEPPRITVTTTDLENDLDEAIARDLHTALGEALITAHHAREGNTP